MLTFGSPGSLTWLRAQGTDDDSVELKVLLAAAPDPTAEALTGRSAPTWSARRSYLLDTTDLGLLTLGVELRLRRRARNRWDLVVSVRRAGARTRVAIPPAARIEFDVVPGALWQDVEVRRDVGRGEADAVVAGTAAPAELLSSAQRSWARVGGDDVVDDAALRDLRVHGPLVVHRVKVAARERGLRRTDLEHLQYPGGEERVELSTRCSPEHVDATAAAFAGLIEECGVAVEETYRAKTTGWGAGR